MILSLMMASLGIIMKKKYSRQHLSYNFAVTEISSLMYD